MIQNNVKKTKGKLFSLSLVDGKYRSWNPLHSKLAALLLKERTFSLGERKRILYLGGGHGTTVSHLSDMFPDSRIFVVEFGITMEKVLALSNERKNVFPIMENACESWKFNSIIPDSSTDLIYQDIAQRNQVEIFHKNLHFLEKDGLFLLMLKTGSISQELPALSIANRAKDTLTNIPSLESVTMVDLEPYQKGHYALWGTKTT